MRKVAVAMLISIALGAFSPADAQSTAPQQTETKPFTGHAGHAPTAAPKPWRDLSGLPPPRLASDLGAHRYPIMTASPKAQAYFDQGLVYAYGFNHLEALRAFRHAQSLDPDCAMCFWGEAYVLGPNLNMPMDEGAAPLARAAAARAVEKSAKTTPNEQALAEAMQARYAESGERAALDKAYADAMRDVARAFPHDPDIATLAAEALMLLSPWDYWTDGGRTGKEHAAEALRLLEGALAKNPDHIAAIHYYIHLVEASDKPERAEPYADRLRGAAPGVGHLVHMPSHIYLRLGRYEDALAVNKDAAEADERYLAANPEARGPYAAMYYAHNVHFYMTAALMAGQGAAALGAAEKLSRIISDDAAAALPPVQPIKQAPYFIHAQFSDPPTILALPQPDERLPFVVAGWRYARGIAYALMGKANEADGEADAIRALAAKDYSALEQAAVPAKGVLAIAENVVRGKAAVARGDLAAARRFAEAAVTIQNALPYMEPPYWHMPVDQTLGAILLKAGDAPSAAAAFKQACGKTPNSAWALYGLMRAQTAAGDAQAAEETARRFEKAKAGGADEPSLDRM